MLIETQTKLVLTRFFLLSLLNNNNSILQLGNERSEGEKEKKKNSIVKLLKIHKTRKKRERNAFQDYFYVQLFYSMIKST